MNILILSDNDWSGAGYSWYEALRAQDDCEVRMVCWHQHPFRYGYDMLGSGLHGIAPLVEWADVLNVHHDAEKYLRPEMQQKPIIMTYHGSWYRKQANARNTWDIEHRHTATCLTIDLSLTGPVWIGRAISSRKNDREISDKPFRVCHAPTSRWAKGTDHVIRAVSMLNGVELDLIENVSNAECLERKAKCHLCVDQVADPSQRNQSYGYGTNALEAWALGLPVVSSVVIDGIKTAMQRTIGCIPFYETVDVASLVKALKRFSEDRVFYDHWADIGRWYVRAWHSPEYIGCRILDLCELAVLRKRLNE